MNKSRKEITKEREQRILRKARALVAKEGFLALKMAALAEEAEISIGTLYTHFEGKEDLIVALATEAWQGRHSVFRFVFENKDLKLAERIIAGVFCDFLFSVDHPDLFTAEQLAATLPVLQCASIRRTEELKTIHQKIMALVSGAALSAIDIGEFKSWRDPDQQASAMDRGVWSLMVGSSYIWYAEHGLEEGPSEEAVIPKSLKQNCAALFTGFGWTSHSITEDVDRMAKYCLENGRHHLLADSRDMKPIDKEIPDKGVR